MRWTNITNCLTRALDGGRKTTKKKQLEEERKRKGKLFKQPYTIATSHLGGNHSAQHTHTLSRSNIVLLFRVRLQNGLDRLHTIIFDKIIICHFSTDSTIQLQLI